MIATPVCSLYSFFAPRRALLLSMVVLYFVGCLFLVSRLELAEDISAFIPDSSPELARSFDLLRHAPFVQSLSITVSDAADPAPVARTLADALEQSGSFTVLSSIESSPLASMEYFYRLLPGIFPEYAYADLENSILPDSVRQKMAKAVQTLSGLSGLARATLVARDIPGIAELAGKHLGSRMLQPSINFSNGLILDKSGNHALVLARPVGLFTSASHASALMDQYRNAVALLPEGTRASAIGGLAHTEANTAIIQSDLVRVLPLAFVLLLLTFLVMFRNRQGVFVFLVPVIAIASASAGASLFVVSLSGIALGFGAVLLGVTDDYPIHIYCATQSSSSVPKALREVIPPLLAGSCSALLAFGVFLFSGIPGVRQVAVFAITGICSAVFFSLVVLPHLLRPGHTASESGLPISCLQPEQTRAGGVLRVRWRHLALWATAVGLLLLAGVSNSSFDGDIRSLSYVPQSIADDEARHREVWGDMGRGGMVVSSGATLDEALVVNDAVWSLVQEYSPEEIPATSLAPFLPSLETQLAGHSLWNAFWKTHAAEAILTVQKEARATGFSEGAFAPFLALITIPPEPVTASDLRGTDFHLLYNLLVSEQDGVVNIYTLLGTDTLPPGLLDRITRTGATFVSGETFRTSLSAITEKEMLTNCLVAMVLISCISLVTFKNLAKVVLTLLPLALSLAIVLAVFAVLGVCMTLFHAVAFPLIMMLGLDYGVFVVAYARQGTGSVAFRGIFISAFTTIAGFGCLIFARHPALHSLGVTATLGMVMAAVASVYILPRLMDIKSE